MKNFDLNSLGVHEMNALEMQETDGGVIWFVVIAAVVLCSSCVVENNVNIGTNNVINSSDSTMNGWKADSTNINVNLK